MHSDQGAAANRRGLSQHAARQGFRTLGREIGFHTDAVVKRSRAVSKRLTDGVGFLMKKHKISVIDGAAKITKPGEVKVECKSAGTYQAKHIIVATGARPRVLPGIEPDKKLIWTYFEAMVPEKMPKSLLVVGSGAIGIEFASFFRTMGSEVTVVEAAAADPAGRG